MQRYGTALRIAMLKWLFLPHLFSSLLYLAVMHSNSLQPDSALQKLGSASVKVGSFCPEKGRRINEDANNLHSTCALRSPQSLLGGQKSLFALQVKLQNRNFIAWLCVLGCPSDSPIICSVFWKRRRKKAYFSLSKPLCLHTSQDSRPDIYTEQETT